MPATLRLWAFSDLLKRIRADAELAALEAAPLMFELRWPSTQFDRLAAIWQDASKASARIEFDPPPGAEPARLYEVWMAESAQAMSDADRKYLRSSDAAQALEDAEPGVLYFSQLQLSKAKPKPRRILSLEAELSVAVLSTADRDVWLQQDFSGLEFGAITSHRGQIYDDAVLLRPTRVLGPIERGSNVLVEPEAAQTRMLVLGFPIYSQVTIDAAADFNFSSEPQQNFGFPKIYVSRRFVDFYRIGKYRGWRFRPVLEKGSDAATEFEREFDAFLQDWRTGSTENRFVGP